MADNFSQRCHAANFWALRQGYHLKLFPQGHIRGREIKAGDIYGHNGSSFWLNLDTGKWADFAEKNHSGFDLVDLLSKRENINLKEALEKLEAEIGLNLQEKPTKALPQAPDSGAPSKVWSYQDEQGQELYKAQRWEKDGFKKSCRMAGNTSIRVPLYLPEILKAIKDGRPIFIVEGEPKADLLKSWGLVSTTFAGGANSYKPETGKWLEDAEIVIIVDSDQPGREFGEKVAADLAQRKNKGIKIIELPGAKFSGYDLIDWQKDGGTPETLNSIVQAVPFFNSVSMGLEEPRPLQIDYHQYLGHEFFAIGFQPYNWLIEESFRRAQLGVIAGPPGSGKGMFAIHLGAALASGQKLFDFWHISKQGKVLLISLEDDQVVLGNRLLYVLQNMPEALRYETAKNICLVPVRSRSYLCRAIKNEGVKKTVHFDDLESLIEKFKPDLVILDTLIKVFGIDENDNHAMTEACGLLEEMINRQACNIILIHHTNKKNSDSAKGEDSIIGSLSQSSVRGASALAGSARWVLMMAPLSAKMAKTTFGLEANGKPDACYVAAKVGKKNAGPEEEICYLERGEHGSLKRVLPKDKIKDEQNDDVEAAHILAQEVEAREKDNEPRLSRSNGYKKLDKALGFGNLKFTNAIDTALKMGLLKIIPSAKGGGESLATPNSI